jgi:hypothetical protein
MPFAGAAGFCFLALDNAWSPVQNGTKVLMESEGKKNAANRAGGRILECENTN